MKENKPLCCVDMAMHREAEELLSTRFTICVGLERLGECTAVITYAVPDEWQNAGLEQLRAVGCHSCSSGFSRWAGEKGISLTMADSLWHTVAEHTLALILGAARNIPQAHRDVRAGLWNNHRDLKIRHAGFDFQGKTFGIWGMGQIGRELAGLLAGFDMTVLYHDILRLPPEEEERLKIRHCSFESLLGESDFFSILIPLNDDTAGLLDGRAFSRMKKGCILVNTARAGIIDYSAFLDALDRGIIRAAALDVSWFEGERQPEELIGRENVIMTPHLGGSTFECDRFLVEGVIEGIFE